MKKHKVLLIRLNGFTKYIETETYTPFIEELYVNKDGVYTVRYEYLAITNSDITVYEEVF